MELALFDHSSHFFRSAATWVAFCSLSGVALMLAVLRQPVRIRRAVRHSSAFVIGSERSTRPLEAGDGHVRVGWWPTESAYFSASSGGRYCASHSRMRSKPAKVTVARLQRPR